MKPGLSVIVANYNKATYLSQCLDSILNQSFKDLEIVIIDDKSTDHSVDIIRKYAKTHPDKIKTLFASKNKGISKARHEAILCSQGQYLTTLDSDDFYYHQDKLKMEMSLLENHKKKGKDIIPFSQIIFVNKDGEYHNHAFKNRPLKEGMIFFDIFSRTAFMPRDFIFKKSAYFEAGGFDPVLDVCEDWDLKIRLAHKFEFFFSGIDGTAHRVFIGGLSSIPHKKMVSYEKMVIQKNIHMVNGTKKKMIKKDNKLLMKRRMTYKINEIIKKNVEKRYFDNLVGIYNEAGIKGLMNFLISTPGKSKSCINVK